MKISVPIILFQFILFMFCKSLSAQENCASQLVEAQKLYKQGLIEDIPQLLKPCIENGFTRVQRNAAYKLLILAYLFDGDQYNAEKTMIEFLKKNPEYEVMPSDPVEFVSLFETFRTLSVFSFGLKLGPNISNPRIIEPFDQGDANHSASRNRSGGGYQAGLSINRYIAQRVFLNLGLNFVHNSYKFIEEQTLILTRQEPVTSTFTLKESLNRYEIPISVGYEFEHTDFNTFIRTGFSISNIFRVTAKRETDVVLADLNFTDRRRDLLFSGHIGAGVKYKIPRGFLVLDVRYHYGFNNIVEPEFRYKDSEKGYEDDDFSLYNLTISFGYYFSFYQPKKR